MMESSSRGDAVLQEIGKGSREMEMGEGSGR